MEGQLLQLLRQAAGQVTLGDCEGLFERAARGVRDTAGSSGAYLYGDSVGGESCDACRYLQQLEEIPPSLR